MEERMTVSEPTNSRAPLGPVSYDNQNEAADINDMRRSRIAEHRIQSQSDPDALIACLSGINADLLEVELYIAQPLLESLSAAPITIEDVKDKTPAINQLVRVAKQSAQLSKLVTQLSPPPVSVQAPSQQS